ncbi:MAG: SAM-dependent methyltransferase [Patescibacteria group bacterium]|jgi:SAM-dependent methyltransferase|nr:SAM-dependent methyltransferase [Patescibacteria group bacterium]
MQIFLYLLVLIGLFLIYVFITMFLACFFVAPWVPTKKKDLEKIFQIAELKPGEKFYELGSGDGRVVFFAQEKFKAKAIGLETALPLVLYSKFIAFLKGNKEVVFKAKSMFKEDLSQADVVYTYLLPKILEKKLKDKFKKELRPGSRVVSYVFSIHGLVPEKKERIRENGPLVYVYRF